VFIRRQICPVELYIELGTRISASIRQLGYPTKNALNAPLFPRSGDLGASQVASVAALGSNLLELACLA
jgi:hypothetical protein